MPDLETWAVELAEELLSETGRRWTHDVGVLALAREIRGTFGEDGELLVAAAALHDTGCSPQVRRSRLEPLDAGWYLESVGAPERLTNLVANLDCAQLEAELRGLDSLLARFPDEEGPVRDALWYCCLTVGPDGERTTLEARAAELPERYSHEPIILRYFELAMPELAGAIERTERLLSA